MFGLFLIIVGGVFLAVALVHFCDTWELARLEPKVVTASELCRMKDLKSSPGAWIAYTFEESKPIDLMVTRHRLGRGGDVKASCLVVRVEDKWLITSVAPGFDDNRLVGRLIPLDSPLSKPLSEKVRGMKLNSSALLPFEFNAVDGSASDQRVRYIGTAWSAGFGLLGMLLGLRLACGGRRPA